MLDPTLAAQLQAHLEKVQMPVELLMSLDDSPKSEEMEQLLHEVAAMSDRITVERRDDDPRRPSFAIHRAGTDIAVRFAGVPLGHEFTSFVLALLQVGGHPAKVEPSTLEAIRALDGESHFETYFSLSCQNCPDVVQALNLMSVLNPRISHTAIDGGVFPEEIEERGIMAVPTVYRNGEPFASGRMSLEEILGKIDETAPARAAERLASQAPFEVLVVGAGPAGATAAIYAARKGLRTGLIAERFGGQLLDTLAIENFSSVSYTEGPKLANELEYHVREYDVEVLLPHRVAALHPAEDGWAVEVADGPTLRTRTLILATGARWRTMGVPGEEEYRTKGVTFCPHCDGPLFAGKRVAVIGGGNSGVEAAIDLAAVVAHVTLLEFDGALRADEVLQRKLASLPNVDVCLNAATQEVLGDGSKVTGLQFMDRDRGVIEKLALDGVFVQIGLLPNTEWLDGTLPLNDRGEIEVDAGGRTSLPGVFAAGDSTSTPFKQIVVAAGAGATAALSASEYLIRS